jgi:hypothetical protein
MQRLLHLGSLASLLLTLPLVGCATTRWQFAFDPSPAEAIVQPRAEEPVVARVLTTVLEGTREGGRSDGHPLMHVRILVENRSKWPLHLVAEEMKLVGSNLEVFVPPTIEPIPGEDIPPEQSRTYDLLFPYPEGMDIEAPELTGLNLSWTIAYPGGKADMTQAFIRREWSRGYYNDSSVHWGFAVGTTIH